MRWSDKPTYFIMHHQNKGKAIQSALLEGGYKYVMHNPDIALFDHTIDRKNPDDSRVIIKRYKRDGAKIFTYPHGATGAWWLDTGMFKPDLNVSCDLVASEGSKHVAEIINPDTPHEVIGWSLCPQKEFERPKKLKRILFASIHPPEKSAFRPEAYTANQRVFKALESVCDKYGVSVRHINTLRANGLKDNPKMIMNSGKPDGSYTDIDNADLIIAEGTFMYLSVARGKPTIGINQHIPIRANYEAHRAEPLNWDKYGEYMAYPIDFDDGKFSDVIERALNEEPTEWRKLFIGEQMENKNVVQLIERYRNIG